MLLLVLTAVLAKVLAPLVQSSRNNHSVPNPLCSVCCAGDFLMQKFIDDLIQALYPAAELFLLLWYRAFALFYRSTDDSVVDTITIKKSKNGWETVDGKDYWYEDGVKQGTEGRGKEIYDPESDAWYWLDSDANGAKAVSKDVYQESDGGKWVRYDENGKMVKGWNTNENGTYYFDLITGAMAHGTVEINGKTCHFDEATGILK